MKRTERRHLKQNELQRLAVQARETIEARQREITAATIVVVVIGGAALGYFGWRSYVQSRAHERLAEALAVQEARVVAPGTTGTTAAVGVTYPSERARAEAALGKFKAAADAYPSTQAGIFARYQQAATLMKLGKPAEAAAAYQDVMTRGGNGIYGQMAKLGLAEAQAQSGQYDRAINTFKELAARKDGSLPVDGILMQLGRTYLDAGKRADAQQTFNRLLEEYPESPYIGDARRELDDLKKT